MSHAIRVDALGKRFLIGLRGREIGTLSETLALAVGRHAGRLRRFFAGDHDRDGGKTEEFWALRGLSFEVEQGEVLGIIGRNGSGKSTLLKILSRITAPSEGEATVVGRVGSLLEIGTGFHSELTGRENIYLSGTILGMTRREIAKRFDEIVAFSGVERFIDTPVKHYSSGMYLRLAFAVAAHLRTEVLLIDEVLAVGDAAFQKKCIEKMSEVASEGRTVLFVSHNLNAVSQLCGRGLLLDGGRIVSRGPVADIVASYGRLTATREKESNTPDRAWIRVRQLELNGSGFSVEPSSGLRFTFSMETTRRYWRVFLQLGLTTPDGVNLVLEAVDSDQFPQLRETGLRDVEVVLPALWLRPGIYTTRVKVIAHPEDGETERFYSEWLDVPVQSTRDAAGLADCLLVPKGQWKIA